MCKFDEIVTIDLQGCEFDYKGESCNTKLCFSYLHSTFGEDVNTCNTGTFRDRGSCEGTCDECTKESCWEFTRCFLKGGGTTTHKCLENGLTCKDMFYASAVEIGVCNQDSFGNSIYCCDGFLSIRGTVGYCTTTQKSLSADGVTDKLKEWLSQTKNVEDGESNKPDPPATNNTIEIDKEIDQPATNDTTELDKKSDDTPKRPDKTD